nr:MAG TPA: hypothetical protein [Caudoviricetes sp.]
MKYVLTFKRNNDLSSVKCDKQQIVRTIQNYLLESWILVWVNEVVV